MKFILLIFSLLFCGNLEDLIKKRLDNENFKPVSANFFQNDRHFVFPISLYTQKLSCKTTELEEHAPTITFKEEKSLTVKYYELKKLEPVIYKISKLEKFTGKISYINFKFYNIYAKLIQNACQQITNSIKKKYPSLRIIPDLDLSRSPILNWNFLALDENYQPVIHIPSMKNGEIDTIKIPGKDLDLDNHFKSNLLRAIECIVDQEEFNKYFDNFDFVKFEYLNKINGISLIDTSRENCENVKHENFNTTKCLNCQRKRIIANWNKEMEQNQEPTDIRAKSEKFCKEFLEITSAKACAIMILYNTLSKNTIGAIIDKITSDTPSFYYKILIFWLKNNTPKLPSEINNDINNKYLKYRKLFFNDKLISEEAEKVKTFYNTLSRCEFITVSNMVELFYAFIICKAYAETCHPRLLIYKSEMHEMEKSGLNHSSSNVLEEFYTIFENYKKIMDAIDLKNENSVYGIIKREIEERLKNEE